MEVLGDCRIGNAFYFVKFSCCEICEILSLRQDISCCLFSPHMKLRQPLLDLNCHTSFIPIAPVETFPGSINLHIHVFNGAKDTSGNLIFIPLKLTGSIFF